MSLNPGKTLATRITTPCQEHSGRLKRFLEMNIFVTLLLPVISNVFTLRQSAVTATEKNDLPHQLKMALCIHLGDVLDSSCSCVAGKVGFCHHISALMLKIYKFRLYKSKTTKDLRNEDENPQLACTSQLQQWNQKGGGENIVLKLSNYSCSSYPTRAFYSGQVDGFRNPMKNELKTRPCLKPVFETISNTDANFLNLHIDKATKTCGDKQLTKQTLNLHYLLLKLNVTE